MQTLFCTYEVYSLQSKTKIYLNNLANTNKIAIVKNAMGAIVKDVLWSDKSRETFLKVSSLT